MLSIKNLTNAVELVEELRLIQAQHDALVAINPDDFQLELYKTSTEGKEPERVAVATVWGAMEAPPFDAEALKDFLLARYRDRIGEITRGLEGIGVTLAPPGEDKAALNGTGRVHRAKPRPKITPVTAGKPA